MNEKRTVHVNCDMGEGLSSDPAIMPFISACNVACGGHAGDEETMRTTVELARKHNVMVGAHPSFPDKESFGRAPMEMDSKALFDTLCEQVNNLKAIAEQEGVKVGHLKPHGALYHLAIKDGATARVVVEVAKACGIDTVVTMPHGVLKDMAEIASVHVLKEGFLDRSYEWDGTLVSRSSSIAMLSRPEDITRRLAHAVREKCVTSHDGQEVVVDVDTWCIHGDNRHAVSILQYLHEEMPKLGFQLA